ncbi:MAG TPA: DUF2339 domain-containing protein [Candidatus Acidoferrum sp.]|nr:DUF2339 domain-containing protein [Candidatus Acidoferrum sp.]
MPEHHDPPNNAWNFEALIGSRVLLGAGLLSLLLGAVFFFQLSNDHQWIPPQVRVLCGLAAGLALLLGGGWLLRGGRTYVAEGITGLGASVLYLSLWGAYGPLHVLSNYYVAFGAMIAVSAALAAIAWARRSENVALAGLLGGYLTPAFLSAAPVDRTVLAVYLAVLSAAMLILAVRCRYRFVEAAAFIAVLCYAPTFAPSAAAGWSQTHSILVATAFFVEFAGALFFAARREQHRDRWRMGLVLAEIAAYGAVLEIELGWNGHILASADAALGAVLLAAAALRLPRGLRAAYAWTGIVLLTRAVEAWGGTEALTTTLTLEGAGLVVAGMRGARLDLRRVGYALLTLGTIGTLYHLLDDVVTQAFVNVRTGTALAAIVALLTVLRELRIARPTLSETEQCGVGPIALITAAALAILTGSLDTITATVREGQWTTATEPALSALWSVAATALVALGFRFRSALSRYLGISVFLITIGKVFAVDLATVELTARIVSFLVLGSVLVAIAGVYQLVILRGRRAA